MINEIEFLKTLLQLQDIWAIKDNIRKRIVEVVADVSMSPYTQARHIFYGFELEESGIFTADVRSALMVMKGRNKTEKEFKTKKDVGGIRITRIK